MSFGRVKPWTDRRQFGRRETGYSAWIRIDGKPSQACVVRNLSEGGALLECDYPRLLPFRFELDIPALGARHCCEARHCTETTIGVEFQGLEHHDVAGSSSSAPTSNSGTWGKETGERSVRRPQDLLDKLRTGGPSQPRF